MTLGSQKFDAYLAANNISTEEAAEALDCSKFAISVWRNGRRRPDPFSIARISVWTEGEIGLWDWLTSTELAKLESLGNCLVPCAS